MVNGAHFLLYSKDPEADRAFESWLQKIDQFDVCRANLNALLYDGVDWIFALGQGIQRSRNQAQLYAFYGGIKFGCV